MKNAHDSLMNMGIGKCWETVFARALASWGARSFNFDSVVWPGEAPAPKQLAVKVRPRMSKINFQRDSHVVILGAWMYLEFIYSPSSIQKIQTIQYVPPSLNNGTAQHGQVMARDGKRWQEMASDGKRWQVVARDGKRWHVMARDGKRWQVMARDRKR